MADEPASWQISDVEVTKVLENALPIPSDILIATVEAGLHDLVDMTHAITD